MTNSRTKDLKMFRGDNEEAFKIKQYLDGLEHNFKGEPIFRLVKANEQFEYREGTFNEFKGELFVRTVYGVKQTQKYPQLKNLWIIEQWFDASRVHNESIKDHNGYECIFTFRDKKFNPLPLRLNVVQLIMKAKKEYRKSYMLSKSLLQDIVDEKERISDQYTYDAIDPSSPIESCLHFKEGVSLAGLEIPFTTKTGK
jgi:hypothetical protein